MKINWGTAIVLVFIGFIGFIGYFVVIANTTERTNHDLVTEDYYQKELGYQTDLDASRNLNELNSNMRVQIRPEGLLIEFPESMLEEKIKGTVSLYRPSSKQLDFDEPIRLSDSQMLIPRSRLVDGRWDIRIFWEYEEVPYLYRKRMVL
ncbi:FixH family protein [Robiginitalea sp. IMCC44478]|uniref:FixH family protein n=1 Tax=Robiginitalea sp. IMCC44478 TaxID=3459122 RepID=UPI004041727F